MDIFAHGLWTAAAAKAINNKLRMKREAHKEGLPDDNVRVGPVRKPLNVWQATFWGMFPDLFAFTIPFFVITLGVFSGSFNFSQIPRRTPSRPRPWKPNFRSFVLLPTFTT